MDFKLACILEMIVIFIIIIFIINKNRKKLYKKLNSLFYREYNKKEAHLTCLYLSDYSTVPDYDLFNIFYFICF